MTDMDGLPLVSSRASAWRLVTKRQWPEKRAPDGSPLAELLRRGEKEECSKSARVKSLEYGVSEKLSVLMCLRRNSRFVQ
jgi:hypothetical protein